MTDNRFPDPSLNFVNRESSFQIFEREEIEQSIPARFARQVRQYPDSPAVAWSNHSLTYEELNRLANRTAREILEKLGDAEEPVAFLLDHGGQAITAVLGILKAGKGYLALDSSFPRDRIAALLRDSCCRLFLTEEKHLPLAVPDDNTQIMFLSRSLDQQMDEGDPDIGILPGRMATLYYTSGSTGEPKGVIQNHRNLLHNVLDLTNSGRLCPGDRLSLATSIAYAFAPTQIFGALCNGASLHPFDLKGDGLIRLAGWLQTEKISWFFVTPSTFRYFVKTLDGRESFPHLRRIVIGGELVQKRDVALYQKHFPDHCVLSVRLASSETERIRGLDIDKHTLLEGDLVPVGYEVQDKEVLLLDDEGRSIGFMEVGEIVVRSRFLSPGYWNKPELTSQCFLPDPSGDGRVVYRTGNLGLMRPDGCLEFRGRKDLQVKVRGFRIEPAEIENALVGLEDIREATTAAFNTAQGDTQLVAYIVTRDDSTLRMSAVRQALRKTLPDHMIPSHIMKIDRIPTNVSGKVDRTQLPPPGTGRPELESCYVPPGNQVERGLAEIWEEIVEVHPIGVKDRLDDLGVDSLHHLNLVAKVSKEFGTAIAMDRFLEEPTIDHMAGLLENSHRQTPAEQDGRDRTRPFQAIHYHGLHHNTAWKRIIKRIVSGFLETMGDAVPYGAASKAVECLCRTRLLKQHIFFRRIRPAVQLLDTIVASMPREDALTELLVCSLLRDLRMAVLARLGPRGFSRWVSVKGLPNLREAFGKERGVVLLDSHFGLPHFEMAILQRIGMGKVLVIGG